MQDDVVHYAGQPVALVVADTYERAQHAASLVRVAYEAGAVRHDDRPGRATSAYEAERLFGGLMPGRNERGDVDAGAGGGRRPRRRAPTGWPPTTTTRWRRPSTVAIWDDDGRLTLHDSTMGVRATQQTVAQLLGLPVDHVRVAHAGSSAAASGPRRWCGRT